MVSVFLLASVVGSPSRGEQAISPAQLKQILRALPAPEVEVQAWGAFTLLTIPMPVYLESRLAHVEEAKAKPVLCGLGTTISRPSLIGGLETNDFAPLEFTDYYYYWVVANLTSTDFLLKSTALVKGPGNRFKVSDVVQYRGNTLTLVYTNQPALDRVGLYKYQVKVAGAGKVKSRFCAGCL